MPVSRVNLRAIHLRDVRTRSLYYDERVGELTTERTFSSVSQELEKASRNRPGPSVLYFLFDRVRSRCLAWLSVPAILEATVLIVERNDTSRNTFRG